MSPHFFASTDELVAALALLAEPAAWQRPVRRLRLATASGEPAWVLVAASPLAGLPAGPAVNAQPGAVEVDGPNGPTAYVVEATDDLAHLAQAVPFVAREPGATGRTYVEVPDEDTLGEVVRSILVLGNDRVALLGLEGGRALVRVDGLNTFLWTEWARRDDLRLYEPATGQPRLLLPAGWDHPLGAHLDLGAGRELWLAEEHGRWRRVGGALRDVYDHLRVEAAGLHAEILRPSTDPPRVSVALRLEPSQGAERPGLWRLEAADRPVLEQLLSEAAEAELAALQAAVVQVPGRPGPTIVLVERPGAAASAPLSLAGVAAYVGRLSAEHLYVPQGFRLAPVLSRRGLVDCLGLSEQHLTLIEPEDEAHIRLWRVPREGLRPLVELVDYLVGEAEPEVARLLATAASQLDLHAPDGEPEPAERVGFWRRLLRR